MSSAVSSGGGFELGGEAVALLERGDLEGVDGVDEALELVGERGLSLHVDAAGKDDVDSEVEVGACSVEAPGLIVGDAGAVGALGVGDELLDSIGVG